jgi:hypothetical protein
MRFKRFHLYDSVTRFKLKWTDIIHILKNKKYVFFEVYGLKNTAPILDDD